MSTTVHYRCPHRNCSRIIAGNHFACPKHWWQLSEAVRRALDRTMSTFTRERIDAVKAARREWELRRPRRDL